MERSGPVTRWCVALLLGLWAGGGLAMGQHVGEEAAYVGRGWETENGLPHNAVTALLQSRDGYLWLGTAAGLARFDGVRFVPISETGLEEVAHLEHSYIWALHEDADGTLWVGSGDGLTRLRDGRATTYTAGPSAEDRGSASLPANFVRALARDRDGTLWVGTYGGGLCRHDGPGFACFGTEDGLPDLFFNALWTDRAGTLWVGTDTGLSQWQDGRLVPVSDTPALRQDVKAFAEADGVLWVGGGTGLLRLENGVARRIGEGVLGAVRSLLHDGDGTLWIGTETNGLFRYRASDGADGALARFRAGGFPAHDDVRALLRDREGGLWVGTFGGGLSLLRRGRVRVIAAAEGLPSDAVNAVLEDSRGALWLATNGGLARLVDGQVQTFTTADGLPDDRVLALAEDTDGSLWVGTNGGGLARYAAGRFTAFTTDDGLPSNVVFSLYTDRQGRVWAGGQGLSRWTGDGFETFTPSDGLADGIIVVAAEEADGTLWFGSHNGGLSRYEDGRFTTFTAADGLPEEALRALHVAADGTLWIGTRGGGLLRMRDGAFTAFTTQHGLPDDILFGILEDDRGGLWVNTARHGIFRVWKAELEAVAQGEAERVTPLVLSRADGLRSPEGVGGFHPTAWKGADGRLWFATHEGVAVVDPARVEINVAPPPVHVEEVLVDDVPVPFRDGALRLGPGSDRIEIRYTGIGFADPQHIRFRHRLEGKEDDWTEAGTQRTRTYDNLAPGRYTFHVAAANPDGVWTAAPATLMLTVVPPWWRTPWALGLWGLLLGGGLYGFIRWRVWSLKQQNEALEALVAARTAQVEAQAEQLRAMDRAKSQFFANLSHEFRTPLTLILGPIDALLERTDEAEDRQLLGGMRAQSQRLLRLINQLLDLSKLDAGAMPLRARRGDLVAFLRHATAAFAAHAETRGVVLDFHTPHARIDLPFDAEKLEHVVGNLLSNAIKFTPAGGKVQMGLDIEGEDVDEQAVIRVRDTGTGIPAEALPYIFDRFYQAEHSTDGLGTGIGLALTRELVALHGGSIDAESTPGFGSTFTVQLPLAAVPTESAEPTDFEDTAAEPDPLDVAWIGDGAGYDEEEDGETAPEDAPLVLVVEDHADVRAFLRQTLAPRYRIAEAGSGEEALAVARDAPPDLVISDVMMPGLDGFDLVRALRADDALAPVPVILLTARADEASRLEGLGAGADDYLAKPFSAAELRARVENLVELRRALRRRFSGEVIVRPTEVSVPSADAVFLDEVRAVVEKHIGNGAFGVEWLADEVHLSRRQLHRKLQALTGLSTVAFIRMMRLERAAQLLEQRAGTVSEIAARVGFQDANYFARIFRQAYGHPPSEHPAGPAEVEPPTDRT